MKTTKSTKIADKKGRITLGGDFANATLLMEHGKGGIIILRRAVTVPVEDEWLFKNKAAFKAVKKGLKQAKAGEFVDAPEIPALEDDEDVSGLFTASDD